MKSKPTTLVILVALILIVAIAEYFRVAKMIPSQQHEQELAAVRGHAEAEIKHAENHYREAVGEELHRREMAQLFSKASARAAADNARFKNALREAQQRDSDLHSYILMHEVVGFGVRAANEALADSEEKNRIEARKQAIAKEKTQLRERRDMAWKEVDNANSAFLEALGDLTHAITELERLGHHVERPPVISAMAAEAGVSQETQRDLRSSAAP